jgi:HK97 family phage major capsid protein
MPLAAEEQQELVSNIKALMEKSIAEAKAAIMADLEGKFGTPDEEYREGVEKTLGELEDQIKELMKPRSDDPSGALGENGDPWCGFKHGAEFLDVVIKDAKRIGEKDARLEGILKYENEKAALDGIEIDTSEFGGYLAPEAFRAQIWERAVEVSELINRIMIVPIGSQSLKIPAFGGYDQSGSTTFGGITFYKEGENQTMAAVRPEFELMEWSMGLHAALFPISDPMIDR